MNILEITVQRKRGDAWPVVVECSQPGVFLPVRSECVLRIDESKLREQPTPLDYGTMLGKALFHDRVRDAFVSALRESKDDLRVLLFVEADDLKTPRWERLCAPLDGDWDFLALDQRLPFSLYLPALTDRILRQGKALVRAIEALGVIDSSSPMERAAARRLRGVVEVAPAWMLEEILSASERVSAERLAAWSGEN